LREFIVFKHDHLTISRTSRNAYNDSTTKTLPRKLLWLTRRNKITAVVNNNNIYNRVIYYNNRRRATPVSRLRACYVSCVVMHSSSVNRTSA